MTQWLFLWKAFVIAAFASSNICLADFATNYTCSPPPALGGKGYCGPSFCDAITNTAITCVFTSKTYDYPALIQKISSKTCTQSTDPRCTSAALKSLMKGQGIKAAYCNDAFLVIHSDGTPGFSTYLNSIRNPPASISSSGAACVTRVTNPGYATYKIPLYPTLLTTSDPLINNVNVKSFPNGGGDGSAAYMSSSTRNTLATYGLPTRGAIGVTVAGQEIFPTFNNLAQLAPEKCEVDTCNEHVGGGGGQPHLHGDPFGSWCLYSNSDYASSTVHPPQIGWSFDGMNIYGRHVSTENEGFVTGLDSCGGHAHGSYAYHYHAQVVIAYGNAPGQSTGSYYYASTTGAYKCLKGDISLVTNYWGNEATSYTSVSPDTTMMMCSGTTKYYAATGITLPNTAASSPVSTPTPPPVASPTVVPSNKPTTSPTGIPSNKPVASPTGIPSNKPIASPTRVPSNKPIAAATRSPTRKPTVPVKKPTIKPTRRF